MGKALIRHERIAMSLGKAETGREARAQHCTMDIR